MENRKIISLTVASIFLLCLCAFAENSERIYLLDLKYDQENLSLQGIATQNGFATGRTIQPENGYGCEVISPEGMILDSFRFDVPLRVYYDSSDSVSGKMTGKVEQLDSVDFIITNPYFENAKSIEFYDPKGTHLLSVDVFKFSDQTAVKPSITPPAGKSPGFVDYLIYLPFLTLLIVLSFVVYRKRQYDKNANEAKELMKVRIEEERLKRG